MPRLQHTQSDPLALQRLEPGRLGYHWAWIQMNKLAFDDYTNLDYDEFVGFTLGPSSVSYEIGDGIGLTTLVFSSCNAYIQMVMYDWIYRDDVCKRVCNKGFELGANRITSLVTEDRDSARDLVLRLGCKLEGRMRHAYTRNGKRLDVEVYGLMKEVQ